MSKTKRNLALILTLLLGTVLLLSNLIIGFADTKQTDPTTFIEIKHENKNENDTPMTTYWQFVNNLSYVVQEGDKLEFDILVSDKIAKLGGPELEVAGKVMRDNGGPHPNTFTIDEANKWQHVTIDIPAAIAGNIESEPVQFLYCADNALIPANTTVTSKLANIKITNAGVAKAVIFDAENSDKLLEEAVIKAGGATPGITTTTEVKVVEPPVEGADSFVTITHKNTKSEDVNIAAYWKVATNNDDFKFEEGDRLEYEVVSSHKILGFGGLDMEKAEGYNNQTMRGHTDAIDKEGTTAHPKYFGVKEADKWQKRSISVGRGLIGASALGETRVLYAIEGTIPANTTITVKLANIKIVNGDKVRYTFLDKDYVTFVENPKVVLGTDPAPAGIETGFVVPEESGEGTTTTKATTTLPSVPEDEQKVKIDGKKDGFYHDSNSIEIVDAYGDGGVNPAENFDDVTGKVWYAWDDNYIYFYTEVKDDTVKVYDPPATPPETDEEKAAEDLRRLVMDTVEMYLDPDPTNNPDPHFDVNTKLDGCAEMRFNLMGGDLSVWNASDKNKRIYEKEYLVPFKTADGYGFEMKWERVKGEDSFRFNMAIQNSSDPHYAVAIGHAWWSSYEGSVEVFFADEPLETTGSENTDGTTSTKAEAWEGTTTIEGQTDTTSAAGGTGNVHTGITMPTSLLTISILSAGALFVVIILAVKQRRKE